MSEQKVIEFIEGKGDRKTICPFARKAKILYTNPKEFTLEKALRLLKIFMSDRRATLVIECPEYETEEDMIAAGQRYFDLMMLAGICYTMRALQPHRSLVDILMEAKHQFLVNKKAIELLGGPNKGWFNVIRVVNDTINTIFMSPKSDPIKGKFRWAPSPILVMIWTDYIAEVTTNENRVVQLLRERMKNELGGWYYGDTVFVTKDTAINQGTVTEDLEGELLKFQAAYKQAEKIVNKRG